MRAHPIVAAAIAGTSFLFPHLSSAVTVPFSENFDTFTIGTATPTNFTQTSTHYSVVAGNGAGDNDYRAVLSSGSGGLSSSAAVTAPELVGNAFTVSTEFTIASFTVQGSSTVNLGLGLLGGSGNFSSGSEYRVLFTLGAPTGAGFPGSTGTVNIQKGSTSIPDAAISSAIPVVQGVLYSLSVSGTYSPTGVLTLVATATNLTSGATTTTTAVDATPLTGQYFGYRTAINASGSSAAETINYDNFSVVPEPSTAVALLSGIGILGFRRRRH